MAGFTGGQPVPDVGPVGVKFGSWQFGNTEHAKPSTLPAGGQDSARMQSLPLYDAKPATLVVPK